MNVVTQMLESHPEERAVGHATLAVAIDALLDVVAATTSCADACLSEGPDMVDCVRACSDTGDVAGTLARVLTRTGPTPEGTQALVQAGAKMLAECGAICAHHGEHHKHCRICSEVCTRAQQALASLGAEAAAANAAPAGS